jgi:hypothetical protein
MNAHSAQFGLEATIEEICLLSDFNVIFVLGSRRRNSCLFEGGRVKRRGRDIVFLCSCLVWFVYLFGGWFGAVEKLTLGVCVFDTRRGESVDITCMYSGFWVWAAGFQDSRRL